MRQVLTTALTATLATLSACNAGEFNYRPRDARADVSADATSDAASDAASDVATDAPSDVPRDGSVDVPRDAAPDVAMDAPTDVATDAPTDVATDAPADVATDATVDVPRDVAADVADVPPPCTAPMTMCGATCVNTQTHVMNCGACGMVCPTVSNGTQACSAGGCHPLCSAGFGEFRGACIRPTTPHAITPLSTSILSVNTPTFRWTSDGMSGSVRIEISRNAAFTGTLELTSDVTAGSTHTATTLLAGVHYWRLSSRVGGVASSDSPVWEFVVPAVAAPRSTLRGFVNDVNRDGLADLLVRSPSNSTVYVYHGAAGDLPATPTTTITQSPGAFGVGLGFVGDINGDGFGDVVAGRIPGDARVFFGSATGLPTMPSQMIPAPDTSMSVTGFGWQISGLGDTNGDGYGDVLISANGNNPHVYVYLGSATGLGSTYSVSLAPSGSAATGFGVSAVGLGDVNGDGFNDAAVGEDSGGMGNVGLVHLYLGSATGIPAVDSQTIGGPMMIMGVAATGFGGALGSMGDVQNDGFNDLIVASSAQQPGQVFVLRGQTGSMLPMMPPMPSSGGATGENWGATLSVGDVNNNGLDDVIVSNTFASSRRGSATILFGSSAGLSGTQVLSPPDASMFGQFGVSRVAGDLNGDGLSDVVVGAPAISPNRRVYVYRQGTGTGVPAAPSQILNSPASSDFGVGFAQ